MDNVAKPGMRSASAMDPPITYYIGGDYSSAWSAAAISEAGQPLRQGDIGTNQGPNQPSLSFSGGPSRMRCTPDPKVCGRLEDSVREFTPIHEISDERRPYSIFGHRFITTLRPASSASLAASSLRTVS